jgi:hypothetical protein
LKHLTETQLLNFLEEKTLSLPLQRHLDHCSACQKAFQELQWIWTTLRRLPSPQIDPLKEASFLQGLSLPSPTRSLFLNKITLAAGIFLIGLFSLYPPPSPPQAPLSVSPSAPSLASSKKNLLLEQERHRSTDFSDKEKSLSERNVLEEVLEEPSSSVPETLPEKEDPEVEVPETEMGDLEENFQNAEDRTVQKNKVLLTPEEHKKREESSSSSLALLCGDLNRNGKLDISDPLLLMRSLQQAQEIPLSLGDFNGDGKVDILDAQALCQQMTQS